MILSSKTGRGPCYGTPSVSDWSGARDLNPGPHGREPYVSRVLPFPAGPAMSSRTQFHLPSCPRVSSRFLTVPRMRNTSVTRHVAEIQAPGGRGLGPQATIR